MAVPQPDRPRIRTDPNDARAGARMAPTPLAHR